MVPIAKFIVIPINELDNMVVKGKPGPSNQDRGIGTVLCCAAVLSHVRFSVALWTLACQALLSIDLSRQEYWSGLPCPPPGYLPHPGIKPVSLACRALASVFFTTVPPGYHC